MVYQKIISLIAILITTISAFTQVYPDIYWIQYTDKNNSPFDINTPGQYLSQRSIDRRTNQGLSIDFKDLPVNPQYIQQVEAIVNIDVLVNSKWLNGSIITTTDSIALDSVLQLSFVDTNNSVRLGEEGAENKDVVELEKGDYIQDVPLKPMVSQRSVLDYGFARNTVEMLNLDKLHDQGHTGDGMLIAVLDAGFRGADTMHTLVPLFNNGQIIGDYDVVRQSNIDFGGYSNHGTLVLGCMGSNVPGSFIGTAPDADYLLIRTEDAATEYLVEEYYWAVGAEWADSIGADVFNTSLGYTTFWDSTQNHSYADMDGNTTPITIAADIAASRGILVVNSAGNSGNNSWHYIGAPADGDSVLAIGATDSLGVIVGFSSRGPGSAGQQKPNVVAQGAWIPYPSSPGNIQMLFGTSFSGPVIAGSAASFWSAYPTKKNMEIFRAIEESAHLYPNPDTIYGYGIPDFDKAANVILSSISVDNSPKQFIVYPNPVSDYLVVSSKIDQINRVLILDSMGRNVLFLDNLNRNRVTLDLSDFPKGVYLVQTNLGSTAIVRAN
ncbi:MAG TPA: peptidase S8 [Flavobacteriales bacterium]|jgi:serine protease AprX|nr:peptidase S8 [Flavobacteriales bacterium]